MFDILISGGTVYDGTGAPGRHADLGINGEQIAASGGGGAAAAGQHACQASHPAAARREWPHSGRTVGTASGSRGIGHLFRDLGLGNMLQPLA